MGVGPGGYWGDFEWGQEYGFAGAKTIGFAEKYSKEENISVKKHGIKGKLLNPHIYQDAIDQKHPRTRRTLYK
jgi:hypothetical protein